MTFTEMIGQIINWSETQETCDPSIASEDAVLEKDDESNSTNDDNNRNRRSIDYDKIYSNKEEGRIAEKLPHEKLPDPKKNEQIWKEWCMFLGGKLDEWCDISNIRKNLKWVLVAAAGCLLLIFLITMVSVLVKKKNPAVPGPNGEGDFDFTDFFDGLSTQSPNSTSVTPKATSAPTSAVPKQVTSMPRTEEPSVTRSPTAPPTKSPTLDPTVAPSTSQPTLPVAGSSPNIASSDPTHIPTLPVQPVSRPVVRPFGVDEIDDTLTFCVIADVPYDEDELAELPGQIETQMEGCEFLVHLGDIFIGDTPCHLEDYETIRDIMLKSHAPAFLVPGDNEWNDCLRAQIDTGWDHWTNHFIGFENNWNHTMQIIRQVDYQENFYFIKKRTLVFGLNIVGGRVHNATEWQTRLRSEYEWVRTVMLLNLVQLKTTDGVIIMAHAHPSEDHTEFFNAFRVFLRDELKNEFPVLYLHGDGHNFLYTPNYNNQPNFLRIQHEGGTNEPVLKIIAGPGRGAGGRSSVYDAFQYDRQLELL